MAGMISKAAEGRKEAPVAAVTQQKKPQTLQDYVQRMYQKFPRIKKVR